MRHIADCWYQQFMSPILFLMFNRAEKLNESESAWTQKSHGMERKEMVNLWMVLL